MGVDKPNHTLWVAFYFNTKGLWGLHQIWNRVCDFYSVNSRSKSAPWVEVRVYRWVQRIDSPNFPEWQHHEVGRLITYIRKICFVILAKLDSTPMLTCAPDTLCIEGNRASSLVTEHNLLEILLLKWVNSSSPWYFQCNWSLAYEIAL